MTQQTKTAGMMAFDFFFSLSFLMCLWRQKPASVQNAWQFGQTIIDKVSEERALGRKGYIFIIGPMRGTNRFFPV